MKSHMDVEDLEVYRKLCRLHIEICDLSHSWPSEEKYEIGSQIRRSSNSSPAQLAEKNDDRHVRNKIEGVNRSRGEAAETIHHLFMAREKRYITAEVYESFRAKYKGMHPDAKRVGENTRTEAPRRGATMGCERTPGDLQ
jgi:four helix bundle protein